MNLEFYPAEKFKKEVKDAVHKYPALSGYRVFFFGSRVRGDNFPRSDIDLGIEGPRALPVNVKLALEQDLAMLPTLYKIDFVDFTQAAPSFKQEALKYIEYVI